MSRLYIVLDNSRCKAGSTLRGNVELRGDEDINVLSITISLIGRCKTKIIREMGDSSQTIRGRAPLVTERKVLFEGPNTLHPGHSWDFEFILPHRCVERGQDHFNTNPATLAGLFNIDVHQDLPPVFSGNHRHAAAFVTYVLEANLSIGRRRPRSSKDVPTTRILDFFTTRTVQTPDPQIDFLTRSFECSSLALNPGHEATKLTFKERLRSLHKSKLPMARFTLTFRYPKVAIVDQTIPLMLSVDHDLEHSTAMAPPMVYLRKCSVVLVAATATQYFAPGSPKAPFAQAPRSGQPSWETNLTIDCFESTKKGNPALESVPPVSECLDLRDLMKLKLPRGQAPTFTTFNIRRTYKLTAKVTIECAQQQFKAEFFTSSLVLLPSAFEPAPTYHFDQRAGNDLQMAGNTVSAGPGSEDVAPPTYAPT